MVVSLLPILCWIFMVLAFYKKGLGFRSSFLSASLSWGLLVVIMTELLSMFYILNFVCLLFTWGLATGGALLAWQTTSCTVQPEDKLELSLISKMLLSGGIVIVILTGLIAAIAAPNNWDSMTYHMSRVMHWAQNQSVAHYKTNIIRQVEMNPWSEFAIMQFQILNGGDYFANLVQWFSMIGSAVGVALIAKQLGTDRRGQIFAAIVLITLPMGILQATSTQNDYAVAFWLVCFVYFGILLKEKPCWHHTLAVGLSLGLAILTKGTAYIYAFPFFIWFLFSMVKHFKRQSLKFVIAVCVIIFAINSGHYFRNFSLFNNPLTSGGHGISNKTFAPTTLISNISRNIALQISTPVDSFNLAAENSIIFLHTNLGININDPNTTWPGTTFKVTQLGLHEDSSANPIHLFLILLSCIIAVFIKKIRNLYNLRHYFISICSSFLLFCIYLKWQPWHSRLHLPLFVLWSPVIAVILAKISTKWISDAIMVILICAAFPWVLFNVSRPLVPIPTFIKSHFGTGEVNESILTANRFDQYFNNRPDIKESYYQCASVINSQINKDIGIYIDEDTWEYPLWVLIQNKDNQKFRMEHVNVTNKSNNIALINFNPSVLLSNDKNHKLSVVSVNK